jgi:hypothetical protein
VLLVPLDLKAALAQQVLLVLPVFKVQQVLKVPQVLLV